MECRRSGQDARGVVSSAGGERRSVQVTWMTLGVLSPTMHLNSSHVFSSLSLHTRTLGSNFLRRFFVALNHMSITNSLCFGTHSSLVITLTLRILALSSCRTIMIKQVQHYSTVLKNVSHTACFIVCRLT